MHCARCGGGPRRFRMYDAVSINMVMEGINMGMADVGMIINVRKKWVV